MLSDRGDVRAIDVVEYMGFSKPSVSRAMGRLREEGYICVDAAGHITLTDTGREVAGKIYERHKVLTDFLVQLGVEREIAAADACKIEHDISDEAFAAIKRHTQEQEE